MPMPREKMRAISRMVRTQEKATYAAGFTAGLLAGLRWAATKTVPHYTGASGIEYQAVEDAIAHVERTGELPEETP